MTVLKHLLFALDHVFGAARTVRVSEDAMLAVIRSCGLLLKRAKKEFATPQALQILGQGC